MVRSGLLCRQWPGSCGRLHRSGGHDQSAAEEEGMDQRQQQQQPVLSKGEDEIKTDRHANQYIPSVFNTLA